MTQIASKDKIYVGIQFLLFLFYLIPFGKSSLQLPVVFQWMDGFVGVLGLILALTALVQLKTSLTAFPTPLPNGILIKEGWYKYMRHPIYSGIMLTVAGFAFYFESWWKTSIAISLVILFYVKSTYEEQKLTEKYSDYPIYKNTTGRFFPTRFFG